MTKHRSGNQSSEIIRKVRIVGSVAYVPLTRGYEAIIDSKDIGLVEDYNWHSLITQGKVYAVRTQSTPDGKRKVLLHRVLLGVASGVHVDHINGDTLDNRRTNLRECSNQQNQYNSKKPKTNTSGYKGVSWYKPYKKWRATIRISGKKKHLGYFSDLQEAYQAYCQASLENHKEFSKID